LAAVFDRIDFGMNEPVAGHWNVLYRDCWRWRARLIMRHGYLFLIIVLVTVSGCGDGRPMRVPVSGTVLIDGQPLSRGNIKFVPENGRPSAGKIGQDGRFTLTCYDGADGAILGKHRVQVAANRGISESKIEWFAPQKYADFRTSEIEVEISQPIDDLKIELKSDGKKLPYIEG
jgi:hypothetical protein